MAKPLQLTLSKEERAELEDIRDNTPKAYMRERAAAILKVADGMPGSVVAREGLLKRRQYQTVNEWVKRYKEDGLAGLTIRPGRGRKPAFSPSVQNGRGGSIRIFAGSATSARAIRASAEPLDITAHP
jgi:hypothetical protein